MHLFPPAKISLGLLKAEEFFCMEQKDSGQMINEVKSLIHVQRRVYCSWSGKHFCIKICCLGVVDSRNPGIPKVFLASLLSDILEAGDRINDYHF
jgi:hypothetical protein